MRETVDMRIEFAGRTLCSPVSVASGTFGCGREYSDFIDLERLGAVVTKGVSPQPWTGGPSPRIAETASGMLNAIGLQNPGVEAFCDEELEWLSSRDVPIVVNVAGHSAEDYARVIERLEEEAAVWAYEINVSCPNVDSGGMAFGTTCDGVAAVTSACRAVTERPMILKLTPNVTDIAEVARAAVSSGADAISLINTLLGMSIDAGARRPRLARAMGGLSGPAIKPVALRMVWQVSQAVDVPLIGMGGISTGEDAVEFMLAGASLVAVGTANFVDPTATMKVLDGIREYCVLNEVEEVSDLVGALEVGE